MVKTKFSTNWKASKQPRKQRKYRYNAPLHIKSKFISAHLSKELREKYKKRSAKLRKGDKIKILRGNQKGTMGKVEKVILKKNVIFIDKIQKERKDGTKVYIPIQPSNVIILELSVEDKKRKKAVERNIQKVGA